MPFPNRSGRPKKPSRQFTPLLTVPQAAAQYGINAEQLWEWVKKGAMPHVRVGPKPGVIRLRKADCEAQLRRHP